jgi:hypothetical protein
MSGPIMPHGQMLTFTQRTVSGQDQFGNDVYSETQVQIGPCSVQYGSSRESAGNFTDQVTTGLVVFVPYGTDLTYLDAVLYNGVKYELTAEPESWVSPWSGSVAPIRVFATVVKGASA